MTSLVSPKAHMAAAASAAAMEEEEEEEEEAWLMDSLRLYNDLHLFELPGPTRVIEWTGDQRIFVAGYENGSRNEILQLLLPPRLLAKQNKGLCPERDFKVERGGICDRPIYRLKHVPGTSLLVTSGPPDSMLQIWRIEADETDVIKLLSVISPTKTEDTSWSKIATSCAKPACVLHGQRICNLQKTEIESEKSPWVAASASPDKIASLDFLDEATAVACGTKGQLFLVDFRQQQGILGTLEEARTPWAQAEGLSWCAGVGSKETPLIARLSSGGLVVLTDIRHPSSPLKVAQCCVPIPNLCGTEFLSISLAPVLADSLAVSGFDATVQVYNTQDWDSSGQEAKPVFIHKGHIFSTPGKDGGSPMVTTHTWHPWKPQTLLSAASDGSLHVWDWSDPRASEPV
ncbi:WD repeat-containing protein 73 [Pituophis catenifer annectens]|uniref:WD repeat-containing protein 73 n=1 Tax=Pituophis catenifer annectens TaxID=94852 RepID=UPI00399306EE